jgi:selenocysteine lyase/cysteine desulfurase
VADQLAFTHGVGVRAGQFCAHPLVRHLTGRVGVAACGETPGLLRASFGIGTTIGHLDRFVGGLTDCLSSSR